LQAPTTHLAAGEILARTYERWLNSFLRLTRQAQERFERRQWAEGQRDSVQRLALYRKYVQSALGEVAVELGGSVRDKAVWRNVREGYERASALRPDAEMAKTFFNSVVRRVFGTVGTDEDTEFLDLDAAPPEVDTRSGVFTIHPRRSRLRDLVQDALSAYDFPEAGWEDQRRDAELAAASIERTIGADEVQGIELARPVFYRNKGAYLVGRLKLRVGSTPLIVALLNPPGGVRVDAVLVGGDEASIVFSFTRSYFAVDAPRPRDLVAFLRVLMPRKPLAELYNAIGFDRHGKTEFYRALKRHVYASSDRFDIAPGARGMVMVVFALPSYDVVFKLIRDRFDPPKNASRAEVMQKYQLVSEHDRAGRLVEAQEFERLTFDRARFTDALLEELQAKTRETVEISADTVMVKHAYTERRVVPLDLYLRQADAGAAKAAVLDYGRAVKDLAATNIFPGDLLLKNFGVTRTGRVVFYDYDELCLVTDCHFREVPGARDEGEETAGEAWYYVGEKDIFPEEFGSFLGLTGELRRVFVEAHGDILTVPFWTSLQDQHRRGEVVDIFPYRQDQRLTPPGA
jgi:isocitrate dehydrogenase kinase/phosphatase